MGYFRFLLALLVCANHLWIIGGIGRYAVFSFYILSGYLMTEIVMGKYGTSPIGVYKYAINRILRIYPMYLLVFIFTIASLYILGVDNIKAFDSNLSLPSTIKSWLMNSTLIGMDFDVKERTIPPSWTLFVELFFYAFIPFAVKMGKKFISLWLTVSIGYHLTVLIISQKSLLGWDDRYGTIIAGSLGFSVGCYFRTYLLNWASSNKAFVSSVAALMICYAFTFIWFLNGPSTTQLKIMSALFFYINILSSAIIVYKLFNMKQSNTSRLLGDYSYPFYLLHLPIGYIIFKITDIEARSFVLLIAGTITTFFACFIAHAFEKRINKIRDKVRCL
ncbi:acyltransferase family protein [Enterobacter oligotrophicus]|uniref:acyltransferase family protein n=1 Tax=Enterobacter oligotrophicus TaxID=2478464 RepID=UPI00142E9B79|nr:acyltransferase [Enterobacter oligotrophicus]